MEIYLHDVLTEIFKHVTEHRFSLLHQRTMMSVFPLNASCTHRTEASRGRQVMVMCAGVSNKNKTEQTSPPLCEKYERVRTAEFLQTDGVIFVFIMSNFPSGLI